MLFAVLHESKAKFPEAVEETCRYFLCRTFSQSPQNFVAHLELKIGIASQKAGFMDVNMESFDCWKIVLFKERHGNVVLKRTVIFSLNGMELRKRTFL